MGFKKKPYVKKTFESSGTSSDVSANIYESMMLSPAWMDLSAPQKALYQVCKLQYYSQKTKPNSNPKQFTMSAPLWRDKYGLYTDGNKRRFYSDMAELINHGFIICAENGFSSRTQSVYEYSDKWQVYGTDAFKVSPSERTQTGRRDRWGRTKETPYPMVTL